MLNDSTVYKYPDTYRTQEEVRRMLHALDDDASPTHGPDGAWRCVAKEALKAILSWQDFADDLRRDLEGLHAVRVTVAGEQKREIALACIEAIEEGGVYGVDKVRRYAADVVYDPECPLPFVVGGAI